MHRLWKKPNPKHQITNKFKILISKFKNEKVCFEQTFLWERKRYQRKKENNIFSKGFCEAKKFIWYCLVFGIWSLEFIPQDIEQLWRIQQQ